MKILVLGGTQFIGRHVVTRLLEVGHDVTLLNRGQTNPGIFSDLPLIKVDRKNMDAKNMLALRQNWDAVIDLSAYFPKEVSDLLKTLNGFAGRYVYCSTVSVYASSMLAEIAASSMKESDRLHDCTPEQVIDTSMMSYGQRKAECERMIRTQESNGGIPSVVIRPSVVYGAYDHTDRFAYWISRAHSQKKFILPDDGLTITQRTYAPDLASAFLACVTKKEALGNAYNIADTDPLNFRDTLDIIGKYLKLDVLRQAVSVSTDVLLQEEIKHWADFPLWLPRKNFLFDTFKSRKDLGYLSTPPEKALSTSTDAFLIENRVPKAGLTVASEQELLKKLNL